MTLLYYTVLSIVIGYVGTLLLINAIPHVRVKSLGWLSVCHITVTLSGVEMNIDKIRFRLSFSRGKDNNLKFFRIDAINVNIVLTTPPKDDRKKAQPCSRSFEELTSFSVPARLYNLMVGNRWMNQLTVRFFNTRITSKAAPDLSAILQYGEIQASCNYEGEIKLSTSLVYGSLSNEHASVELKQNISLFRNVEFVFSLQAISSVKPGDQKHVHITLDKYAVSLSLGKLNVPVDFIKENTEHKEVKQSTPKHFSIETISNTVLAFFDTFDKIDASLEELTLSHQSKQVAVANLTAKVLHEDQSESANPLGVRVFLTAFTIHDDGYKLFELPSASIKSTTDPKSFINAAVDILKGNTEAVNHVDMDIKGIITNPTVHLYYDQLVSAHKALKNTTPRPKPTPRHSEDPLYNPMVVLNKLRVFSARLGSVDMFLKIHLPKLGSDAKRFVRGSQDNWILSCSIQTLVYRFFTRDFQAKVRKKLRLGSFVKFKSVKVDALGNTLHVPKVSLFLSYNVVAQTVSAKLNSKLIKAASVNDAIFILIRKFRNASNIRYNARFAELSKREEKQIQKEVKEYGSEPTDIFEVLPSFVSQIRVHIDSIETDILCKDHLPSQIIQDPQTGEDLDLGDYKRGVFVRVDNIDMMYQKPKRNLLLEVRTVSCYMVSGCHSEYIDDFDDITMFRTQDRDESDDSDMSSVFSDVSVDSVMKEDMEAGGSDYRRVKRVLQVHHVSLGNQDNRVILRIPELDGRIDIFFVWCMMYAVTLVQSFKPTIQKKCSHEEMERLCGGRRWNVDVSIQLESACTVLRLPNTVDIMLELDDVKVSDVLKKQNVYARYIRLYVIHPATKLWTRLIVIDKPSISIELKKPIHESKIGVQADLMRLNIPHQFLFYTVIDNIINLVKSARQIRHNFANVHDSTYEFEKIWPEEKPAILLPEIRVRTPCFALQLENDPFQDELAVIFQLGKIEQKNRLKKFKLFEEEAERILANADPDIEAQIELTDAPYVKGAKSCWIKRKKTRKERRTERKSTNAERGAETEKMRETEKANTNAERGMDTERGTNMNGAKRSFSTNSTPTSVFTPIGTPSSPITRHSESLRSTSPISFDHMPNIDERSESDLKRPAGMARAATDSKIMEGPHMNSRESLTHEQALSFIEESRQSLLENLATSWIRKHRVFVAERTKRYKKRMERTWGDDEVKTIVKRKFRILGYTYGPSLLAANLSKLDLVIKSSDLEDVDEFLSRHGKSQPKLVYSILVPLYFSLQAGRMYMILKDYPLPFVSFPSNSKGTAAVSLSGNLVVNEKLVERKEEMRYIYVPFSPAIVAQSHVGDSFYSVYVPRTLSPVKMTAEVRGCIDTDRACMVTWNKAYQPTLSEMSSAFDNFTKPPVDDSPLGWWDKLSLILHGKVSLDVPNELCLNIKSSMDPYDTAGRAAGFTFSWQNNVHIGVNETGDSKEVIRVSSDDFVLAVPNYSSDERQTWGLFFDDVDGFDGSGSAFEARKFHKRVVKLSSADKVTWVFGMQFERNKYKGRPLTDAEERTSDFKNHWDIMVTNPAFEYHPDSYEGFRSDYVHMQLSVISKSKTGAFNAGYLTPLTFNYFFYWWNTLNNAPSPPIRQGPLFNTSRVKMGAIKTGAHIFTVKYMLVFEPLTISHMYLHNTEEKVNGHTRVAFTGLKGKFSKCEMFLRQRKEYVTYINECLGIHNQVYHLKMNAADVNADSVDLRVVHAVFPDRCPIGSLMANYEKGSPQNENFDEASINTTEFGKWIDTSGVYEQDLSWVDLDDFSEFEFREVLSSNPILSITPFCYSPNFTYIREFNLHEDGPYPFGRENFGHYNMEVVEPEQTQVGFLKRRIHLIEHEIRKLEDQIRHGGSSELVTELELERKKLEVVESIWENMVGSDISSSEVSSVLSRVLTEEKSYSRSLSRYSHGEKKEERNEEKIVKETVNVSGQACKVDIDSTTPTSFHNRFIVHNLQLKWDNQLRDHFLNYIQRVSDRKTHVHFMTRHAIQLVQSVLSASEEEGGDTALRDQLVADCKNCEQVISQFESEISKIDQDQEAVPKYLVKLVHPQIQLRTKKDPNSCMLVTSRDLELRILSVMVPGMSDIISESAQVSGLIESRYGVLFRDSHVFVFHREDTKYVHPDLQYGSEEAHWPPWVECEVWYDSSWAADQLIAERNSMAMVYKKPNFLFSDNKPVHQGNSIKVHLSKIVVNTDSRQYSSLYYVVTDLLVHTKTQRDEAMERLFKVVSLSDSSDFAGLDTRIAALQDFIRTAKRLVLQLDQHGSALSPEDSAMLDQLEFERQKKELELDILMRGVSLRSSKNQHSKHEARFWSIMADQMIWHILDERREPLVDLALANVRFTRVDEMSGSNYNEIHVPMVQGFNLQAGTRYPELLRPLEASPDPIFTMSWRMMEPVGGIPIMQGAQVKMSPLKIALDYATAKALSKFMFPDGEEESTEDSDQDVFEQDIDNVSVDDKFVAQIQSLRSKNPFRRMMHRRERSSSTASSGSDSSKNSKDVSKHSSHSKDSKESKDSKDSHKDSHSFFSRGSPASPRSKTSTSSHPVIFRTKSRPEEVSDDVAVIMDRSKQFMSIVDLKVHGFKLFVSFHAPGGLHVLNVNDLHIEIPTLHYKNKLWSGEELIGRFKKDIIKVILQHTGKILGNKFRPASHRKQVTEPLKQISDYSEFMTLQDLQHEGRSRTAFHSNFKAHGRPHLHHKHHHHKHVEDGYFESVEGSEEDEP